MYSKTIHFNTKRVTNHCHFDIQMEATNFFFSLHQRRSLKRSPLIISLVIYPPYVPFAASFFFFYICHTEKGRGGGGKNTLLPPPELTADTFINFSFLTTLLFFLLLRGAFHPLLSMQIRCTYHDSRVERKGPFLRVRFSHSKKMNKEDFFGG